jgi:hypothetical protein
MQANENEDTRLLQIILFGKPIKFMTRQSATSVL